MIEGNDYIEFVVGRGIDEDELIAAARGADFGSATATVAPDAVPAGLEPLRRRRARRTGPGPARACRCLQGRRRAAVSVRGARRPAPRGAVGILGRGRHRHRGARPPGLRRRHPGRELSDPDARGRVWAEDGMVLSVVVTGGADGTGPGPDGSSTRWSAGCAWARGQEFEALDEEIRTRPPTREERAARPGSGLRERRRGASRWAFQLEPDELPARASGRLRLRPDRAVNGGGGAVIPRRWASWPSTASVPASWAASPRRGRPGSPSPPPTDARWRPTRRRRAAPRRTGLGRLHPRAGPAADRGPAVHRDRLRRGRRRPGQQDRVAVSRRRTAGRAGDRRTPPGWPPRSRASRSPAPVRRSGGATARTGTR